MSDEGIKIQSKKSVEERIEIKLPNIDAYIIVKDDRFMFCSYGIRGNPSQYSLAVWNDLRFLANYIYDKFGGQSC